MLFQNNWFNGLIYFSLFMSIAELFWNGMLMHVMGIDRITLVMKGGA